MTLASCSEWDDHYDGGSAAGGSDASLWRQMSANPQLSDFCKVLEQTKVFRMHKKTPVSYAQLLDGGQLFTVVAPVNGSFNRDSLLAMLDTPQGDSIVEKSFIFNHLSRSATSLRSDSQTMLLLNSKHVAVGGNTIEGVAVVEANKHASNGVLHVASRPLPYEPNLYEALCDMPVMSAIGSLLRQYEEDYFDADASVSSGIVEGVPVYVDSVVIEYNKMLNAIGLLGAEDSLYWVVAPTADGWQRVWDKTSKYFEYDETVQKRDSIQQYWTMRALMDDAVFNMTDQSDVNKAIVSVPYLNWRKSASSGKPVYHRFVAPFEPGGVLYGAQPVQCSNGVLYQTQEWPFRATDTWFKEIWAEGESTWLITEDKNCTYNARREVADSISESAYLQVLPQTATSNWELTYRLNNTLSGDYDICLILLPKSVSNQNNPDKKPCKFKATLSYVDAKGITQTETFGNKQFTSKPERVDTVVLAERFHLPACNYDQSDIKVTLRLQCSILPRENTTYSREMYLDCIYLRPRE
ncbi:MAG: fasciclin domain-containing protein [Prevotella sp.]|nr:fasciclin domain-containing protein [Prevotella sp.]